jgi:hypothetical protein
MDKKYPCCDNRGIDCEFFLTIPIGFSLGVSGFWNISFDFV